MPEKNVKIAQRFFQSAEKDDIAGALSVLDENIEWIEPEARGLWFSGIHRGADEALQEVVAPTFDKVDNFRIQIDEYLDAGDNIIAIGKFQGKAKTTGHELNIPVCFVCTVKKDKIVRFRAFHNTAMWLEAMGQPVGSGA